MTRTIPINITAPAGLAVTAHNNWSLCHGMLDDVTVTAELMSSLVAAGSAWKYNDSGANLGTAWRTLTYDDASWLSGPAQLGFGDRDESTVIASNRQMTTYFRRTFTVADPGVLTNLVLQVLRDDGAIVYLNDAEIFRNNMPGGTISYLTPALSSVPAGDETTNYYSTNLSAALLVSGAKILAVEIHQNINTSPDLSFDLALTRAVGHQLPPQLLITRSGDSINLSWPGSGAFNLYSAPNLVQPINWTLQPATATYANGRWTPSTPFSPQGDRFFQLQSP